MRKISYCFKINYSKNFDEHGMVITRITKFNILIQKNKIFKNKSRLNIIHYIYKNNIKVFSQKY